MDTEERDEVQNRSENELAVIGVYRYRGIAAVTYYLLTLHGDGTMELHDWRDMGGRWDLSYRGRYSIAGSQVHIIPDTQSMWRIKYPEDLSRPLHARYFDDTLLLVSDDNIAEFDYTAGAGATEFRQQYSFLKGWEVFRKRPFPKAIICIQNETYEHALTVGKLYIAIDGRIDRGFDQVRLVGDRGRTRWFPTAYFSLPSSSSFPLVTSSLAE